MTELAIIGADIQQIVGSAIALKILFGAPLWFGCILTAANAFVLLYLSNRFGTRKLELFFSVCICTMLTCFFATLATSGFDLKEGTLGLVLPTVPSYGVMQAVGTLGAVVMPHNIFLHSSLVQSRFVDRTDKSYVDEANKYNAIESGISLFIAFLINASVVLVFAVAFFDKDCAEIDGGPHANVRGECKAIGLADSGAALESTLSGSARYVWAIGLLAAGQASTLTGTIAGQVVFDGFIDSKLSVWKRLMISRLCALVPSLIVALATSSSSNVADRAGEILNVLQSIQLPFALIPVLRLTSDSRIMGDEFSNGPIRHWIGVFLAAVLMIVNFVLVGNDIITNLRDSPVAAIVASMTSLIYLIFVGWVTWVSFSFSSVNLLREPFLPSGIVDGAA
jgi:NRAMP (natural resistance-associated macrophage protein)-like metal ion transporter